MTPPDRPSTVLAHIGTILFFASYWRGKWCKVPSGNKCEVPDSWEYC